MPKWEKFLDEAEEVPTFEKFDKSVKNGRRLLKRDTETTEEKEQRKREIDEKRAVKRRDEV